jgi:hypothetical protein
MDPVAGDGAVDPAIFEWISFADQNPIHVSVDFGPIMQIRIFVEGVYHIRLECPGATVPTEKIEGSTHSGFIETGQSLTLSAPGFGFDYQWLKDGSEISGATEPELVFNSLDATDAGQYSLAYNNGYSEATVETEPYHLAILAKGSLPTLSPLGLAAARPRPGYRILAPKEWATRPCVRPNVPRRFRRHPLEN